MERINNVIDACTTIYYRGSLNSCNYSCSYCVFSTKKIHEKNTEQDREELDHFFCFVQKKNNLNNIFFTPYGEALIHEYYMETIAKLTLLPHIQTIGIQTNNSFSLKRLQKKIHDYGGYFSKILLWCTCHFEQTTIDQFLVRLKEYDQLKIAYTVGAVASKKNKNHIFELREKLRSDVYFWLNKMDQSGYYYYQEDIDFFYFIDPYFMLEMQKKKANMATCSCASDSFLMHGNGDCYACHSSKIFVGNVYVDQELKKNNCCKARICHCFVSYSHRKDIMLLSQFEKKGFRQIKAYHKNIYFFDIDGTLLNRPKTISNDTIEQLKLYKQKGLLFFNTSLDIDIAKKYCRSVWWLFDGGVFSSGADIHIFDYQYEYQFRLNEQIKTLLEKHNIQTIQTNQYKIIMSRANLTAQLIEEIQEHYGLVYDKQYVYITNKWATKNNAIKFIQRFFLAHSSQIFFFDNNDKYFKDDTINNVKVIQTGQLLNEYTI